MPQIVAVNSALRKRKIDEFWSKPPSALAPSSQPFSLVGTFRHLTANEAAVVGKAVDTLSSRAAQFGIAVILLLFFFS
jgi:hypothetical protein